MNARARAGRAQRQKRESTRPKQTVAFLAVGIAIAAFLIGYGVTALAFTSGTGPSDVVMVPDVREMSIEEAARAMSRLDLESEVGDSFPNAEIPEGAILAQSPLPGEEVSPGTSVRLIVSTGRPYVEVPDVESMSLDLAVRALQTAGFDVMVEEETADGELGNIVESDPVPGTPLRLPATVRVVVGGGMPVIEAPLLIGMLEDDARQVAEEAGLEAQVVYQEESFAEPGAVVAQNPAPGDSLEVGSAIELRIARPANVTSRGGGEPVEEPNAGSSAARESGRFQ